MKRQLPVPTDPNAADVSKKNLSPEGTLAQKRRVKTGPAAGHNPYDTATVRRLTEQYQLRKKPADMRKLSDRARGEFKKK
jgi:hypothetical protein